MIDIDKAFENRWRIKSDGLEDDECRRLSGKKIKELCRDFFEAGLLIGEGFTVAEDEECGTIIYKHDPILDTDDSGFTEWWDMYGKKVDRKKCIKKWNKLSDDEKRLCLNATPAYVASTPDVTYRKNPLTYLNGECWNDEIITKNGTDKPAKQNPRDKLADILVG